jgi:signal transduction histidine kinase
VLQRVLAATLASVVLAVVLLGLPLTVAGLGLNRAEAQRSVQARADALAGELDRLVAVGAPVEPAVLDPYTASTTGGAPWPAVVRARLPGGDVLERRPGPAEEVEEARRIVGTATTTAGVSVEVAVARRELVAADVRLVVLIGSLAAGAVAAAWALAQVQARRLVRPLTDLAATADQLGAGRVPPPGAPTGIAEVDQVAGALAASAGRISRALAAEREFSADASHQLRTPLTALSMRLEEIAATTAEPATAAEAEVALAQVERLTAVVEDLLHRPRAAGLAGPGAGGAGARAAAPLREVLVQQAREWEPVFARAGRRLDVALPAGWGGAGGGVRVDAAPGPVSQALATLLENALAHGGGTTRVRVRTEPASSPGREEWVVVEVADEGPGVPEELGARIFERAVSGAASTGLGLALARDLVVAEGGRLELVRARPAVFGVFLRRAGAAPRQAPT